MLRAVMTCLFLLFACKPPDAPAGASIEVAGDNILVIGDFGTGDLAQMSVAAGMKAVCAAYGCDFGLTVGDNFYPKGVSSTTDKIWQTNFERPYQFLAFTFYPTLGNHDYMQSGSAVAEIAYKSPRWYMPGRYYSLVNQDAEFFAVDTERFDDDQKKWLDEKLAASKATWKIVYGHHPMYSNGSHGDTWTMHGSLGKLLKKHSVDMYLAGHDHHLELQIKDGIAHVISGAAAKSRGVRAGRSLFIREGYGFAHISFAKKHHLQLRFADELGRVLLAKEWYKP